MIPQTSDCATLVGAWAQAVENRGLLLEKFALPKVWGQAPGAKLNDAGRWNVLRIVTRGSDLLREDARRLRREAGGRNTNASVSERKEKDAGVAESMAQIARSDSGLSGVSNKKAQQFLKELSQSYGEAVITFEATLGGRLLINLAGGVVENAGMALDRCFGDPFIPGSAVKGLTRAQALWEIRRATAPEEKLRLLRLALLVFGYGSQDLAGDFAWAAGTDMAAGVAQEIDADEFRGCVCFLPAFPTSPPVLVVDMVNPHYPEYYRGKRPKATDDERPIPNYFPAVEAGSVFGFAVLLNRGVDLPNVAREDLLRQTRIWLQGAITGRGMGAKAAAGYGWFELGRIERNLPPVPGQAAGKTPVQRETTIPVHPLIAKWRGRLATKDNFPAALPELAALTDVDELRGVFEAIVPDTERHRLRRNQPYWQSFTSGRHAEAGKKILQRLGLTLT